MKILRALALSLLVVAVNFGVVRAQLSGRTVGPQARKFDELTTGIGSPRCRWGCNNREQEEERKARLLGYAKQLRREGARAYIIGYGPRIAEWEIYDRSYGEMRAGQAREGLTRFFDFKRITTVDGGFRETAITELWIVPPGARPPQPTPTVKPEQVAHCPFTRISALPYVPKPNNPLEFKAIVEANDQQVQPTFAWRVSQGQIIGGQGTDTIKVEVPVGAAGGVVATVNVIGYSLECPVETTTATNTTTIGIGPYMFDEFGSLNCEDEAARLDNLAITLQDDPALQAHVVIYGSRVGYLNEALARAARMTSYLVQTRGIEAGRVLTVDGGYRHELSGELWLSLRGTAAPTTRPTVDKKYAVLKGQMEIINSPCSFE